MGQKWWEEFDSSLYVDIETYQQILDDWAADIKTTKRMKLVTGPAGAGKSWFLKAVKLRWNEFPDRLVFELDVPGLVNKDIQSDKNKILNKETVCKQLGEYAHLAVQKGYPSWNYDESLELSRNIEIFSRQLAEFSTENNISVFILVDGYDEVEEEQSLAFAIRILDFFAREPNCRIVLCRRDSFHKLSNQLRTLEDPKNDILISAINAPELQLEKFKSHPNVQNINTDHLTFPAFKESLEFYQWNHAFINSYLFALAHEKQSRRPPRLYDPSDIEDCINVLIQRPFGASVRFGPIESEEFHLMQNIAVKLDDKWTDIDLDKRLQTRFADQRIRNLFRFGVLQTTMPPGKRKIVDGLRELLRDLNKLRGSSNV